jgi:hypothetical protein
MFNALNRKSDTTSDDKGEKTIVNINFKCHSLHIFNSTLTEAKRGSKYIYCILIIKFEINFFHQTYCLKLNTIKLIYDKCSHNCKAWIITFSSISTEDLQLTNKKI